MNSNNDNYSSQEVFYGQPSIWVSSAYDADGRRYLHDGPVKDLVCTETGWANKNGKGRWKLIGQVTDPTNWRDSAIDRVSQTHDDTWEEMRLKCINGDYLKGDDGKSVNPNIMVDYAKSDSDKTVITCINIPAKQQLDQAQQEITTLKSLVKIQEEQLGDFERNEHQFVEVISEVLQTLHAADPNARISLTSSQLLQLLEYPKDESIPF